MERQDWMASDEEIDKRAAPIYPYMVLGGYVLQLFLAIVAPFLWQLFAGGLGLSEVASPALAGPEFQIANGLWIGAIGLALGATVQHWVRSAYRAGRWIWVPLVGVLVWGVWSDYLKFGSHQILADYFYEFHPGSDEGAILRDLLTYPALSAVCYSVGVYLVFRRAKGHAPATG